MTIELLIFVLFTGLVLFNNGVQAYIHFEAYPLFKFVGQDRYAEYVEQYEKRLTIPLLAPYGLTVLSNLLLLGLRPDGVSIIGIIVALILNVAVAGVSLRVATPVYELVKANGPDGEDFERLMQINLIRLGISTAASVLVLIILLGVLS